ncbi:hypothetical protein J2S43_008244 [Catenuloplanes nepalensis]|uniref:Legume lectin domain-containing protein n=1 Tax=Catenuloplanes nepalensis TaxID=587533 RepID=A0ABT9N7Q0_9ACTN|nr:hypothetical protein [Catenuloplanes nepalensis]MDP9799732.1 hypothetical protein [Catenuloplanes nepalensis]
MSLRKLADAGRGATGIVLTGLAIVTLTAATISWGVAIAADDDLTGGTVDDRQLAAVLTAAHSCPMLSSHRLAGQLMAESGLNPAATATESGGSGLAGLDDEDWKKWAPWPGAARTDTYASVLAMAHKMCSLSGELRQAGLTGDAWRLSLAAYRSGQEAVVAAKDVPEAAAGYVDRATGYASYYEKLPQFGRAGAPLAEDASNAPEAKPLPEAFVPLVATAGKRCPEISAATVAAQLMAGSGFDPNHLGAAGREGIAQFRSDVWERYGPRGSVWDPAVAIPAVGTALCILTAELRGVEGDPHMLALAAFNSGPDTVRRAGGIPDAVTRAHLQKVTDYTSYYRLDTRIGGTPASAGPSASASASASPTPSGSATPGASGSASPSAESSPAPGAAAPAPQAAGPVKFSYPSFSGTGGLRLNGAAKVSGGKLALTSATNQVGSAYSTTAIDPSKSFSTSFTVVISQPTDGMAFLLQSAGAGAIAAGTGESMGYSGISPSVAVEFDTWDNSGSGHGDPAGQQHIGIMGNGNLKSHLAWADPHFDMRFGQAFHVWVDYDAGAKRLSVFASQSTGKPGSAMVSHNIDLGAKFGGAKVYAGFAGATGNTNLTDSSESISKWTFTGK